MVRIDNLRLNGLDSLAELLQVHRETTYRQEGNADVLEFLHLRDILRVACYIYTESVEVEHVSIPQAFWVPLGILLRYIVGRNAIDNAVAAYLHIHIVFHHVPNTHLIPNVFRDDKLCVGSRKDTDGIVVEVVELFVGNEDEVSLGLVQV